MDKLLSCQNVAIKKGGKLISDKYSNRKLNWQCENGHTFLLTAHKVINRGLWCKKCGASNGERIIRKVLTELGIKFIQEYKLPNSLRRYDFYFQYNNKNYIVEFDGEQHFKFVRKYHKKKENFNKSQIIDRVKTYNAFLHGYHIIRIDYTQLDNIKDHIIKAIDNSYDIYISQPEIYNYITKIKPTHDEMLTYG